MKNLGEKGQQELEISDLDDLLRKEREMEKQRKEAAPSDTEVNNNIVIFEYPWRVAVFSRPTLFLPFYTDQHSSRYCF